MRRLRRRKRRKFRITIHHAHEIRGQPIPDRRVGPADLDRDFDIGQGQARGDVQIGVPDGLPTYLDLKTVTGRIRCDLEPGQKPAEGERALMLRARTVSGDITVVKV